MVASCGVDQIQDVSPFCSLGVSTILVGNFDTSSAFLDLSVKYTVELMWHASDRYTDMR